MTAQQRFGDPRRFAMDFELIADPDAGGSPERRVSWGRLRIWVAGRNLTLGQTPQGGTTDAAEVPLLPIVEWLAAAWDPLLHEERLPRPTRAPSAAAWRVGGLARLPEGEAAFELLRDRDEWWRRHGLGAALPDFRVPDVHFRRWGSRVEVSWDDREWRTVPSGVLLAERPGHVLLPAEPVARVLFEWALAVLRAVEKHEAADDAIRERVYSLRGDFHAHAHGDRAEARLEWLAGIDLESAALRLREMAGVVGGAVHETVRALLGLSDATEAGLVTPATVPALLFRSASPSLSPDDLAVLLRLARGRPGGVDATYEGLRAAAAPPSSLAETTEDGLERASALRVDLAIPRESPLTGELDLETVLLSRLGIAVEDVHLDDTGVDGVAIAAPGRTPAIAVNRSGRFARTPWGRRMTLAHELCHLLYDIDDGGQVGVVSNPWADPRRERRANAFAVMLLVPEPAVESVLPRDPESWTPGMLRGALRVLGVGATTLTWQLHNLGWIDASERQAWVDELSSG